VTTGGDVAAVIIGREGSSDEKMRVEFVRGDSQSPG
jgi:hypothetical protein